MLDEPRFDCMNCGREVLAADGQVGTYHRNHCPACLHSRHVDLEVSGDRAAGCGAVMVPVGVTFKRVKPDKYGKARVGDVMLVHRCAGCGVWSINRVAADDDVAGVLHVMEAAWVVPERVREARDAGITLVVEAEAEQVRTALMGKRGMDAPGNGDDV